MTTFLICSLFLLVTPTLCQAKRNSDHGNRVIVPKLYRILETENDINLEKLASKEYDKQSLLDFLENNAMEYGVDNVLDRHKEKSFGAKKEWIERIVPGYMKSPVHRHKSKNVRLEHFRDTQGLEDIQNEQKALRATFDAKKSKASLPSIHVYTEEAGHLIQHLREVDAIIGQLDTPYLKRKFLRLLEDFEKEIAPKIEMFHRDILNYIAGDNDIHSLRAGAPKIEQVIDDDFEKNEWISAEVHVPVEPEEISNVLFPPAPLWNDWTYQKTLQHNYCPEGQIKITNICVKMPHY